MNTKLQCFTASKLFSAVFEVNYCKTPCRHSRAGCRVSREEREGRDWGGGGGLKSCSPDNFAFKPGGRSFSPLGARTKTVDSG